MQVRIRVREDGKYDAVLRYRASTGRRPKAVMGATKQELADAVKVAAEEEQELRGRAPVGGA